MSARESSTTVMLTTSRVARDLLTKTNDRLLSTTNAQRRQYPCCYCIHIGSDYRQAYNPHIMPPSEHNTRYCGGKTTAATNELPLVLYVPCGMCMIRAHTETGVTLTGCRSYKRSAIFASDHQCLVSSVTFPFIRSNKIEFYFSVPVRSVQRQRRYGTAVRTRLRKRFTETDMNERKRNAGNQA